MLVAAPASAAASPAALGEPATAASSTARTSALGTYCGHVNIGYTNARVYGIALSCPYARGLFGSWRARPTPPNRPPPRVRYVRGFRCVFGGTDYLVKLDCYRGRQIVRGRWGG